MKLAYIATEVSTIKTLNILQKYYSDVHYYFADGVTEKIDVVVDKMPILVGPLTIPADLKMQTPQHKSVLSKIALNKIKFFENIYSTKVMASESIEEVAKLANHEKYKISDISFIKYNREKAKYAIENTKQELIEYDFLVVQNNQLVMSLILDKQQNIFHSFSEQSRAILTFEYSLKSLHSVAEEKSAFIFIENGFVDSIEDNWYIVQIEKNKLVISFYIPIEMQQSEVYLDFLDKRIANMINMRFVSFKVEQRLRHYTLPGDGYYTHRAKLRHNKCAALVPSYTLWSEEKLSSHLNQIFKNKKNNEHSPLMNTKAKS